MTLKVLSSLPNLSGLFRNAIDAIRNKKSQ